MGKQKASPHDLDQDLKLVHELMRALELLDSKNTKPEESLLEHAKSSGRNWKFSRRPVFNEDNRPSIVLFTGLVGAVIPVLKSLQLIRRYYPDDLEQLIEASRYAGYRALGKFLVAQSESKLTTTQRYDRNRRLKKWSIPEIERIEEPPGPLLKWLHGWEPVVIFDKILSGKTISMVEMQDLFGMARKEFSKNLEKAGRGKCDYRAVAQVLESLLLSERRPKKRKKARWYRDPDRRARVLKAIETRLEDPCLNKRIADEIRRAIRGK